MNVRGPLTNSSAAMPTWSDPVFANRYTALIDACTLVSVWRRNLLLSLAEAEFFRIRWSEPILTEIKVALIKMARERNMSSPNFQVAPR